MEIIIRQTYLSRIISHLNRGMMIKSLYHNIC